MNRISSPLTFFNKRLLPLLWLVMLGALSAFSLKGSNPMPGLLIVYGAMAAVGLLVAKLSLWSLADEVFDAGDSLLIRNDGSVQRIALRQIVEVDCSRFSNPTVVTLWLETPDAFGKNIKFMPNGMVFMPFGLHPVANDLRTRIQFARHHRKN